MVGLLHVRLPHRVPGGGEVTRALVTGAGSERGIGFACARALRAADEETGRPDPGSLPSGDVLAREFQRFLRQRGEQ